MIFVVPIAFALIGLFVANVERLDRVIYEWEKKRGF